jgi:hypothetical protein
MAEQEPQSNPLDTWRQFITDSERQWNGFFKDVLGTDAFSGAMNTWVEASLTVQRMIADQLERYYSAFNIPTHGDLVALGERMKSIEDTLARLETQLATARSSSARKSAAVTVRAPSRAKPKRTRKPPVAAAMARPAANGVGAK